MILKSTVSSICLLILLAFTATAQSKTYTISSSESNFRIIAGKAGLLKGLGHDHEIGVKTYSGQVIVMDGGKGGGNVSLDIDAKSLVVLDKKVSDSDRKKITGALHNDVLESSKHQQIILKSASVSNVKQTGGNSFTFTMNGDLTLHGVTKRLAIPINLTVSSQQIRATGQYTIKQTDFGIKPFSAALGTIKVKNDVVVHFDIVGKT